MPEADDEPELACPPVRPVHSLGIFIPIAVVLELAHASPVLVFSAAALGVIPTAARDGRGHRAPRRPDRARASAAS